MDKILISIKNNYKGILIMLFASLFTAIGQFCWKQSSEGIEFLLLGFLLYGVGAVLMILAFKYGSYSVVHPVMCMGYIFALFLGYFFLEEVMNFKKIIGVFAIIIGVIMIGGGDH